ncbi:cation transporter [filamentous cyanobacterium CCP5]|nr:cation transporter [filamentous cyanobacterium CCP5]
MNEGDRYRRITYRLLVTTLWSTLLVLAVEASIGWASHSLTLLTEALHTLIDAFSTVLSLIAVASPQRTLGREIWGHGRAEVAATLMLAAFLGFTGVSILLVALRQLVGGLSGQPNAFTAEIEPQLIQFTAAMVIVIVALGIYVSYQSRALSSLSLRLNAKHFLSDAWLSLITLAVLMAIWRGQQWIDPLFAIPLLGLAVRSFWRVLNYQLPMLLLPTAIAPEAIAHQVQQVEGVTRCTRIRSRGMVGRQVWVELHLAIHPEYLASAELIGERTEAALRQQYGPIRTQIWIEAARPELDSSHYPYDLPENSQKPNWLDGN